MNTSLHWDRQDVADYFLDVLPPDDCREFELHLAECESCTALALRMHESWETLERELTPDALAGATREPYAVAALIRESVWQSLIAALEVKAEDEGFKGRSVLWLQEMKQKSERLSSALLPMNLLEPDLLTLGEPHAETEPASPSRPVMVIGPEGLPQPVIRLTGEGRELFVVFPQVPYGTPPEVFIVFTTRADSPMRIDLKWRQSTWSWRGPAPEGEFVLVVGVPF